MSTPEPTQPTQIQSEGEQGITETLSILGPLAGVPGYQFIDRLGRGAYGEVWRARQLSTDNEVAVKVFTRFQGLDRHVFRHEVERLLRLDKHRNIVTILDAGLTHEPPYYVMQIVPGGTLADVMNSEQRPSVDRVLGWMKELAEALAFVHAKGLIHCDLKPGNVLLDEAGHLRVSDFGQSRVFSEASAALGTLFFMAPEQARALGDPQRSPPDFRWDVFAFGATMYSILTGHAPRATDESTALLSDAPDLASRLARYRELVFHSVPAPCAAKRSACRERELEAILLQCLQPNPEHRYRSIEAVQADLAAIEQHRPISSLAKDPVYRTGRFLRRHRTGVAVAAAIALAFSGGGVWLRGRASLADETVEGLIDRGDAERREGQLDRAQAYFSEAVSLRPRHPRALGNLAILMKERFDVTANPRPEFSQEALDICDRALAVNTSDFFAARLWNIRGALCKQLERYDEAVTAYQSAYQKLLKGDDRDYEVEIATLTNMGVAYALKNDSANAEKTLRDAADLDANLDPPFCYSARDLGMFELAMGRSEAAATIEGAMRCYSPAELAGAAAPLPDREWIYLLRARFRLTRELGLDPLRALEDAKSADLLTVNRNPLVKRVLAWAFLQNKQYAEAIQSAQMAVERGDLPPTASQFLIAIAAARSGELDLARSCLEKARASWPVELREPRAVRFVAPKGNLWFEAERELEALQAEAEQLLN